MDVDLQSRIARTFRAWTGLEQAEAASRSGIAANTLLALERGRACSDATWTKVSAFYESRGLSWRDGEPGIIVVRG